MKTEDRTLKYISDVNRIQMTLLSGKCHGRGLTEEMTCMKVGMKIFLMCSQLLLDFGFSLFQGQSEEA